MKDTGVSAWTGIKYGVIPGVTVRVEGDSDKYNYVGTSLPLGCIIAVYGCLYGATSGATFLCGQAGEQFVALVTKKNQVGICAREQAVGFLKEERHLRLMKTHRETVNRSRGRALKNGTSSFVTSTTNTNFNNNINNINNNINNNNNNNNVNNNNTGNYNRGIRGNSITIVSTGMTAEIQMFHRQNNNTTENSIQIRENIENQMDIIILMILHELHPEIMDVIVLIIIILIIQVII